MEIRPCPAWWWLKRLVHVEAQEVYFKSIVSAFAGRLIPAEDRRHGQS